MPAGNLIVISRGVAKVAGELAPFLEAFARLQARERFPVLIREPELPPDELATLLRDYHAQVQLIVHDRCLESLAALPADLSLAAAVHLRMHHLNDETSKLNVLAKTMPFGVSCHDRRELDSAFASGAAYALVSPVFSPQSKPEDCRETLGVPGYLQLAAGRRVFALGGITAARHRSVCMAGGAGSAVLGEVFGKADASAAAKALWALLRVGNVG